jgi:hypothetical protein
VHVSELTYCLQSKAEKKELEQVVSRKLRVIALTECSWYSGARINTLCTSAADYLSCLAAINEFVANYSSIKRNW